MKPGLKRWIADWLPPHVRRSLRSGGASIRYSGRFASWDDARRNSLGYDAPAIVEKVRQSLLKVRSGEAAYERDSVTFDRVQHAYPLLVGLLRAALRAGGRLNVTDVGGSLGSSYFQCRTLLEPVASVRWNVIEQPAFVECGRAHFEDDHLRFHDGWDSCVGMEEINVVLLSGVLPYLESPHALLKTVAAAGLPHVIIDRTPLWSAAADRLTVQSVPASIYGFPASYPAWILNRERLLEHFLPRYRLVLEFDALSGTIDVDGLAARDTGFLLEA